MAAHLADKPARSLHHRSERVAENAVGAANNVLRLAEGSSFNVVFFEGHSSYHNNTVTYSAPTSPVVRTMFLKQTFNSVIWECGCTQGAVLCWEGFRW
jgi:hypothetical protein